MKQRKEQGSFTIEAMLSMMIFMFAFLAIATLAGIAKVESTTQHAINQVAKEVSQYYYLTEKVGITFDNEGVEEIDDAVQAVLDFSAIGSQTVSNYEGNTAQKMTQMISEGNFEKLSNDVTAVTAAAQNLYNSFGPIMEDPKGVLTSLVTLVKQQIAKETVSRLIAQPLCKALFPKYITSSGNADETLEKMGVVDGLDGIDFRMSSFAVDGRSINVVIVYQVKIHGFGIFDDTLLIRQTASTAAWVTGVKLAAVTESESKWEKDDLTRGKDFVAELKAEELDRVDDAVKKGIGIDFYDIDTNTFTTVHSMNVFSCTYSTYQVDFLGTEEADNYQLNEKTIKSTLKAYSKELDKNIKKIGDSVKMEDGRTSQTSTKGRKGEVIIVVPEEANNAEHREILNDICRELEEETGHTFFISYREKALGG